MPSTYDVTVPLAPGLPVYPGDPPFEIEPMPQPESAPFKLSRMSMATHTGTHVDAPAHFLPGGATVDSLPPEILIGKARVVEMERRLERDPVTPAAVTSCWKCCRNPWIASRGCSLCGPK